MTSDGSNFDTGRRRIAIKAQDLDDLYMLVQGAPYANTVIEAKAPLSHQDFAATLKLIESARDRYRQAHVRLLRQDPKKIDLDKKGAKDELRRLKNRQAKCRCVLDAFEDVIATLDRMIKLRAGTGVAAAAAARRAEQVQIAAQVPKDFRLEFETANTARAQLAAIRRHYQVRRVNSAEDIQPRGLYYLQGKQHAYLILVPTVDPNEDMVEIRLALSGQPMKAISKQKIIEMGRRQSLVRLLTKDSEDPDSAQTDEDLLPSDLQSTARTRGSRDDEVLDIGTFSQLYDAAKRCGLVPNADTIAHTRDREFRRRDYPRAFQILEGLFGKFTAAASLRDQKLRREDLDIAAGKIKISPKKLMEKRARDTAETQLVNRARAKFLRVLEGLRILMRN